MKENAEKARSLDTTAITQQLREQADQAFKIRFQMSMGQTGRAEEVTSPAQRASPDADGAARA